MRDVRDVVNATLEVLGISLRPSVRYRVLVQHPELFEPSRYTDLLAHSLGVPPEYVASGPVAMDTDSANPATGDPRTGKGHDATMQGSRSRARCRDGNGKWCKHKRGKPTSDLRTIKEPDSKLDTGETRLPEEKPGPQKK